MSEKTLKNVSEEFKKDAWDDVVNISKEIKMLFPENVVIKEKDFIKYFLPLISKKIPNNEKNMKAFKHNMFSLTNSYFIGISVHSDDLKELLFKLPPFLLEPNEDSSLLKNISYSKLLLKYDTMKENGFHGANKYMEQNLQGISSVIKPNEDLLTIYALEVDKIYKRYNITDNETIEQVKINKNNNITDEEIFDYD